MIPKVEFYKNLVEANEEQISENKHIIRGMELNEGFCGNPLSLIKTNNALVRENEDYEEKIKFLEMDLSKISIAIYYTLDEITEKNNFLTYEEWKLRNLDIYNAVSEGDFKKYFLEALKETLKGLGYRFYIPL